MFVCILLIVAHTGKTGMERAKLKETVDTINLNLASRTFWKTGRVFHVNQNVDMSLVSFLNCVATLDV